MTLFTTFTCALLAAGSLPGLALAAPVPNKVDVAKRTTNTYSTTYTGNGATSEGWPAQSSWWDTVDDMFNANNGIMKTGCAQFNVPNNSDGEIADVLTGIKSVAASTGVDARFILAIVLQESNGCVRAPTTSLGVRNPGLLQSHNGAGTCNEAGSISNPCPQSSITQQIQDGVGGTSSGDGLVQCIAKSPGKGSVTQYYDAARIYNSGSIDASGNLGAGIATHCYASDIANRLTGWSSGPSTCNPATVGTGNGSPTSGGSPGISSAAPVASSAAPVASSAAPVAPAPAPAQTYAAPSAAPAASPAASPAAAPQTGTKTAPGVAANCAQFYTVQSGDSCWTVEQKYGLTFAQFQQMNTQINAQCSNLWLGYNYCVKSS